jgi:hypothetical protein
MGENRVGKPVPFSPISGVDALTEWPLCSLKIALGQGRIGWLLGSGSQVW